MKTSLTLLFSSITLLAAHAADPRPRLTLAEATQQALACNPSIQGAMARWEAARDRVAQAGAWEDPQLSAMSRYARFVAVPRNAFADQTVSLAQMLPISGRNKIRARAAACEALAAYQDVRRAELDVTAQTRAAYYQLGNARAQVELSRQNLVLLEQIAEVTRIRYQAGSQGAADVLAAQTEAGKLLESAKDLDRSRINAESQLNQLMGRDAFLAIGDVDEPYTPMVELPVEQLKALVVENRPEVVAARYKLDAERLRLEEARRGWIPDPTLTVQGQRYNDASQLVSELDAGLSIGLPWVNARKYHAAIREAASNVAAAQADLAAREQEAIGMLRTTLTDIDTAMHHQHVSSDKLLDQARDSVKASEIAYEAGKMSLAEWIGAAASLRDLEAMRRQHGSEFQIGLAQLEAVIGAPVKNLARKSNP